MDERIKDAGFVFIGKCHCIGPLTNKYIKGKQTLYHAVKHGWIKVKERNKTVNYLLNEKQIDEFLLSQTQT